MEQQKIAQILTVFVVCLALYISAAMFTAAMGTPYSTYGVPYAIKIEAILSVALIVFWVYLKLKKK